MFTGIIEEVGSVKSVSPAGAGVAIRVAAPGMSSALREGESVSIDGACQTVVAADEDGFRVEAVATTLGRTTLGDFRQGRRVNLERALALGDRLGGHLVQGHVDGVGRVRSVEPRGEHTLIDIAVPDEVAAITVLHGSLALNGVSLTVNALPAPGVVQLSIIPFTLEHTALADLAAGDAVNLEADLIGKYVQRLVERSAPHPSGTSG
ncbi:MAG: riboflavin synthase [Longimicrobiaceae bacterium]